MPTLTRMVLSFVCLLMIAPVVLGEPFQGYVEEPYGNSSCLTGTHYLVDPCTQFSYTVLNESAPIDLDAYRCAHVVINGPDVGLPGCPVIQPTTITSTAASCPLQPTLMIDASLIVEWWRLACTESYDVIRGALSAVVPGTSQINLGTVQSLVEDVPPEQPRHYLGYG